MSAEYRRLTEGLPARSAPSATSFATDSRRVKSWVASLPRANQMVAHRQLLDALQDMRSQRLDGVQRLAALEALRPVVLEAIDLLDGQAQGGSLPLPPPKAKALAELRAFEEELAFGYRLAVIELCAPAGSVPFLRGGSVALALERAIFHASRLLTRAYFVYDSPREGEWNTLHALFGFARSVSLEDKAIDEVIEEQTLSVGQIYAQALLLALSNPYRFSQREQADLWPATRDLASYVSLSGKSAGKDSFAVATDRDQGPGYIPEERTEEHGPLLWLDLDAVRQLLERPLADGQGGALSLRLRNGRTLESSVELLRRLRAGWSSAGVRRASRLAAGHALETVIGLSGLHYRLAGDVDFETFLQQSGLFGVGGEQDRAGWAPGATEGLRRASSRAQVLDQSLNGYRLRWPREEQVRARVGEIIGIAFGLGEGMDYWMVGSIRWLRHGRDGSVDAGVSLLARRADAVAVRAMDGAGVQRPMVRGVQYQPLGSGERRDMHLLTSALFDTLCRRMELVRGDGPDSASSAGQALEHYERLTPEEQGGDYVLIQADKAAA
ncbi:MAG: hypothetical protein WCZ65_07435 [Lysobacteraceae bacterium]